MEYAKRLERVSVLGAAGKMGSGIVLLTALEMADLALDPANRGIEFALNAVDVSSPALGGLMRYLRSQALRAAEKKAVALRKAYEGREDLVENEEVIREYVDSVLALVRPTTRLESAYDSSLVFEAVNENPGLKVKLLGDIREHSRPDTWFLTNTSSIPIRELDEKAGLGGRIMGVHFYNPPAVQKLVELIKGATTLPALADFTRELAKRMRKTVVPSHDVAGFIGNGHFMRDLLHGLAEAERLAPSVGGFAAGLYLVNKVTQDYLVRPMGIFQLADYVGLDVCRFILDVMNARLPGRGLHSPRLDALVAKGVLGGQFADGAQKDGLLKYEKGKPVAVYDLERKEYKAFDPAGWTRQADEKLGAHPDPKLSWKSLSKDPDKGARLATYFSAVRTSPALGAQLARAYQQASAATGKMLVASGVAASAEDVNAVLTLGFFHVYGPINDYL